MMIGLKFASLRESRWYEFALRFVLGGFATLCTGLVATWFGPSIGGLFLAFPALLCASATLVQSHTRRRKHEAGLRGNERGKDAAALDAAGAALGSIGMAGFAVVVYGMAGETPWQALACATVAWAVIASGCWWLYKRRHHARLRAS